jgi:hypothetical protein
MTGLLTDVMHDRADRLGPPPVDLEAITRDGDRRVRHRRTALVGGIAAAAVVVAAGSALLGGGRGPGPDGGRADVADGTDAAPVALSWVEGSTLRRVDSPDVDLGVDVRAWVWAGDDIVLTDEQHRVRLWTGEAMEVIGRTFPVEADYPELVSDGSFVAWVDAEGRLTRYDVSDGDVVVAPDLPGGRPRVTAIDGAQVYAADTAGIYSWQPTSPDSYRTVSDDPQHVVLDAESGTRVIADRGRRARVTGPAGELTFTTDSFVNLSPDGTHLVSETDDEGVLLDTTTGERVALETRYAWALPFQWLDSDTVAVLAFSGSLSGVEEDRPHLLSCAVSTGACAPSQPLAAQFQLPVGIHFGD